MVFLDSLADDCQKMRQFLAKTDKPKTEKRYQMKKDSLRDNLSNLSLNNWQTYHGRGKTDRFPTCIGRKQWGGSLDQTN